MAEVNLTQIEADLLINMPKQHVSKTPWTYPSLGEGVSVPLISADRREKFTLDIWRSGIILEKGKYQNRGREVVVLVRLDFGGPPHRNPDGEEMAAPHLHLYRENYGDKWAFPVPLADFANLADRWQALIDFLKYCNVMDPLVVRQRLQI